MSKPHNKCAVCGHPAGHDYACNDCDPCLFGSFPEEWCPTCHGDCWVDAARCTACSGTGFRDSDEHPKGEDAERLSGEAMPARAEGIAQGRAA